MILPVDRDFIQVLQGNAAWAEPLGNPCGSQVSRSPPVASANTARATLIILPRLLPDAPRNPYALSS